jgi:ubiquitin thioesterase protein OTUB1
MYSHNRFQTMDQSFGQRWPSTTYDYDATPAPQPQITPVQPYPPAPPASVAPGSVSHQDFMSPLHASPISHQSPASHHSLQMEQQPVQLPFHPAPPPVSIDRTPIAVERGGPFRPSMYELEPGFGTGEVLPFQTNIFRK